MSSSFFLKKEPKNKKRKAGQFAAVKGKSKNEAKDSSLKKKTKKDEEILSDDEYPSGDAAPNLVFSSDEAEEETPQDKRLRLAKEYLEEIEKQEANRAEENELHDQVSHRLQKEYLDSVGKLRKNIAASIEGFEAENVVKLKHKKQHLSMCSLALSSDGAYLFTGAKTQFVLKWDLKSNHIVGSFDVQAHNEDKREDIKRRSHVVALCLSSDFRFLAIAEGGRTIQIWCPKELKHLKTFHGHRDVVTSLVFRKDTHELYSASRDRSVKIWSLDEMAYIETLYRHFAGAIKPVKSTLERTKKFFEITTSEASISRQLERFGHQAAITGIDALSRERALTSGGPDCTLRIWKITEESQLIYNGHRGSIENAKFINDENFLSSGVDGSICLWSALKKKPLYTETLTHGSQPNGDANWVSAISCVINSDLIASGSSDGFIRLWQCSENYRKLKIVLKVPVEGFVNCLAFNSNGTKLYAAIGQEHKWGRWWRLREAKNQIIVIDLIRSQKEKEKQNT